MVRTAQAMLNAITSGDSSVWAPHLSARWFLTDEEGRHVTRSDFLAELRGLPVGQQGRLVLGPTHFARGPGVVVMSYDIDEWHNYYGQELRTRFHSTDTWVKEDGRWTMLASQITALPTPIAGRALPRSQLDQYAGTYSLTPAIRLTIVASDSGLIFVRASGPPQRLYALDERAFVRHGVRGFWLFARDADGVAIVTNWRDNNPVVWRKAPPQ